MVDGDVGIFESGAIVQYLLERYGESLLQFWSAFHTAGALTEMRMPLGISLMIAYSVIFPVSVISNAFDPYHSQGMLMQHRATQQVHDPCHALQAAPASRTANCCKYCRPP